MHRILFAIQFFLAAGAAPQHSFAGDTPVRTKPADVASVITGHFKTWDKSGDGKLSREEIDAVIAKPAVRGDEAAAAAALHVYFRDNPKAGPITLDFVRKSAARKPPAERRDEARKGPHFEADFERFREHIRLAPREAFVDTAPHLQGVKQGSLGDCYFVCVLGALLDGNRQRIKRIFHPPSDGEYELSFPDGNKVAVKRSTDDQLLAKFGQTGIPSGVRDKSDLQGQGRVPVAGVGKASGRESDHRASSGVGRGCCTRSNSGANSAAGLCGPAKPNGSGFDI